MSISDSDEVFYDAIDPEIISPGERRSSQNRMSGILQLSKFSIPPSATATPRSTSPLAPQIVISQPGSEHDDDDDGTVGELGEAVGHLAISNHNDEYEEDDGDGDIVITDDESEQPSGSLLHTKTNSSEGGSSTILRTLELTAQTRIQRVRVKAKKKARVHFADLNLIQQLTCPSGTPVFSCKFSPDGAYLALGCGDGMIRVWAPLSELILQETGSTTELHELRTAAIFTEEPIQILAGHTAEVIDLSWSSNNFLLSASTDGTARLWSPVRSDCLAVFPHSDIVTSVAFHPTDDRLFISGSFDCRIRLWSIEERKVKAWNELPSENVVTAVGWSGNGRYALAGSSSGILLFFETEGFKYYTQILVKSSRGKNAIGKKISSISIKPGSSIPATDNRSSPAQVTAGTKKRKIDEQTILVSSNDSRLRAYMLRDKSECAKYLGHANESSQIQAAYSDDAEFIISGSEDGRCFIWPVEAGSSGIFSGDKRIEACDVFYVSASGLPCTAATFAPTALQGRLQAARIRPALAPRSPADGRIIATADTSGRIRIFENNTLLPDWLASTSTTTTGQS